jgi:hypothetical protein
MSQCSTFHPKINPKSEKISTTKRNANGNSISEILYKDAHERFNKEKELQKTVRMSPKNSKDRSKITW